MNMNTLVKRAKSTALGKKCNPSLGPTKHRKRLAFCSQITFYKFCILFMFYIYIYNISVNLNQFKRPIDFRQPPHQHSQCFNCFMCCPFRCLIVVFGGFCLAFNDHLFGEEGASCFASHWFVCIVDPRYLDLAYLEYPLISK